MPTRGGSTHRRAVPHHPRLTIPNARITALRLIGKNHLLDTMFTPTPVTI